MARTFASQKTYSHRAVESRNAKYRNRFPEIPPLEPLLKYIPCTWRKNSNRSLRGGLYLSENYITFYCASKTAKEPEEERKLTIELVTITEISKVRSLNIFPDSICIRTAGSRKFIFSQILSRNAVYKTICDLCGIQAADSRRSSTDSSGASGIQGEDLNDIHVPSFKKFSPNTPESASSSVDSSPLLRLRQDRSTLAQVDEVDEPVAHTRSHHFSRSTSYHPNFSLPTENVKETEIGQKIIRIMNAIVNRPSPPRLFTDVVQTGRIFTQFAQDLHSAFYPFMTLSKQTPAGHAFLNSVIDDMSVKHGYNCPQ